jgi:hypothetical protein
VLLGTLPGTPQQSPSTPKCRFVQDSVTNHVTPTDICTALRQSLAALGPRNLCIQPDELEGRSLRTGEATALLCAKVDQNSIQILGCWKSDAMIRYLHISANSYVIQRTIVFQSGHEHSVNLPQLSIFLLQGGVFTALQTNNCQTFAKLKVFLPSHLSGNSFLPWTFGRRGAENQRLIAGAIILAESPMFLLQYPSFHQRIANRKGGGHVGGKFTSRWSDGRMKGG